MCLCVELEWITLVANVFDVCVCVLSWNGLPWLQMFLMCVFMCVELE